MTQMSRVVLACLLIGAVAAPAGAALKEQKDQGSFAKALAGGSFEVNFRYRYEFVSADEPQFTGGDGYASTLRTTLGYRSDRWNGLSLFGEFQNVANLGLDDDHNNLGAGDRFNGVTDRPVIADPPGTEVLQAFLQYDAQEAVTLKLGRQVIKLGDQRFVGPVGWRQNWQTFDALRVDVHAIPNAELSYAYVDNVLRITGASQGMRTHLFDATVSFGDAKLVPYIYWLDWDDSSAWRFSTATYGARWTNTWKANDRWSFPYHAEFAYQTDVEENPRHVDAIYYRLGIKAKREQYWAGLGYEVLGDSGDQAGAQAFTTPLATLHGFNGWADRFLVTPDTGLRDLYIGAGGTWEAFSAKLFLHDFSSTTEGLDYGREVDLLVSWRSPWKQVFSAKVALYNADDFAFDTDKFWVWTTYKF